MDILKIYICFVAVVLASTTTAYAEPITATLSVVGGVFGLTGGAAVAAGAAVATTATLAAIEGIKSIALGSLPSADAQGVQVPRIGGDTPVPHIFGRTLDAVAVNRRHTQGSNNESFFESRVLSYGPIDAIEEIRFNNIVATLGTSTASDGTPVTNPEFVDGTTSLIHVSSGLGGAAEPVDAMAQNWGGASANYRHQPFAYLAYRLAFNSKVASPLVTVTALMRGIKIYDPRDLMQDPEDQETWLWTENPALIAAWYVRQRFSYGALASEIDWDSVTTAANICDEIVTTPNGTEKRYVCGGKIWESDDPQRVLESIIASMAGDFVQPKTTGKWQFYAGAYATPILDIIEDDIINVENYSPHKPLKERFTKVLGVFVDSDQSYQSVQFPPASDATALSEEGGEELEHEIELPFVHSSFQAQRIASIILQRSRRQVNIRVNVKLVGYLLSPGDRVTFTDNEYGLSQGVFRVVETTHEGGQVTLTLQQDDSNIYVAPTLIVPAAPEDSTIAAPDSESTTPPPGGGGLSVREIVL